MIHLLPQIKLRIPIPSLKKKIIFLFCFIIFIQISGCSRYFEQYYPNNIRSIHKSELAEIVSLNQPGAKGVRLWPMKNLQVDDNKVSLIPEKLYLSPGNHQLKYEIKTDTDEWIKLKEEMEKKGFHPDYNNPLFIKFKKQSGESVETKTLVNKITISEWRTVNTQCSLEGGKRYYYSSKGCVLEGFNSHYKSN